MPVHSSLICQHRCCKDAGSQGRGNGQSFEGGQTVSVQVMEIAMLGLMYAKYICINSMALICNM